MTTEPVVRGVDKVATNRVSFLEQAAILLAQKSTTKNDLYKNLSAACANELREFSFVEQVRPATEIKRSICKKCRVYLVPDANGRAAVEVRRRGKLLTRRCLNCDHEVEYVCNPNYRTRNERTT